MKTMKEKIKELDEKIQEIENSHDWENVWSGFDGENHWNRAICKKCGVRTRRFLHWDSGDREEAMAEVDPICQNR